MKSAIDKPNQDLKDNNPSPFTQREQQDFKETMQLADCGCEEDSYFGKLKDFFNSLIHSDADKKVVEEEHDKAVELEHKPAEASPESAPRDLGITEPEGETEKPQENALTLEDIEKMQQAAAQGVMSSGLNPGFRIVWGHFGIVLSIPRDLGLLFKSGIYKLQGYQKESPDVIALSPPPPDHDCPEARGECKTVYEQGLPCGSDRDCNNPCKPCQPHPTSACGNLLVNDYIPEPASITVVIHDGIGYVPDANGVIKIANGDFCLTVWTKDLNGHEAGDYEFKLKSAVEHPDDRCRNVISEVFTYVLSDEAGLCSSSADLRIKIVDDIPKAINDCKKTVEQCDEICGNVMRNDVKGADKCTTVTSITYDNGAHTAFLCNGVVSVTTALGGTLTVYSDGTWKYEAGKCTGVDSFGYTITDSDGDSSSAVQPICVVKDQCAPPPCHDHGDKCQSDGCDGRWKDPKDPREGSISDPARGSNQGSEENGGCGPKDCDDCKPHCPPPEAVDDCRTVKVFESVCGPCEKTTTACPDPICGNVIANDCNPCILPVYVSKICFDGQYYNIPCGGCVTICADFGKLEIKSDGSYKYDFKDGVCVDDCDKEVFKYTLTDKATGCISVAELEIKFDVDARHSAVAKDDCVEVDAIISVCGPCKTTTTTCPDPIKGNVISNDCVPCDTPVVVSKICFEGQSYDIPCGGCVKVCGEFGELEIKSDGCYTYTLKPCATINDCSKEIFTYTLLDKISDCKTKADLEFKFDVSYNYSAEAKDDCVSVKVLVDVCNQCETSVSTCPDPIKGNVILNDCNPCDNPVRVSKICFEGKSYEVPCEGYVKVCGQYGELEIKADGCYIYTLNPNCPPSDCDKETFTYTLLDKNNECKTKADLDFKFDVKYHYEAEAKDDCITVKTIVDVCKHCDTTTTTCPDPIKGNVIANDCNPCDDPVRVTKICFEGKEYNIPCGGSVKVCGEFGELVMKSDGCYTYTIDSDAKPRDCQKESFTYTLLDEYGNCKTKADLDIKFDVKYHYEAEAKDDCVTVKATVEICNHCDTNTTTCPDPIVGNVIANDCNPCDDPVRVTKICVDGKNYNVPCEGSVKICGEFGELEIKSDGCYTYTINPNKAPDNCDTDVFTYTLLDEYGNCKTKADLEFKFDVKYEYDATAKDDCKIVKVIEDCRGYISEVCPSPIKGNVTSNDCNPSDNDIVVTKICFEGKSYDVPCDGNAIICGDFGKLEIDANGCYTYTLNECAKIDDCDSEIFTYTLLDKDGNCLSKADLSLNFDVKESDCREECKPKSNSCDKPCDNTPPSGRDGNDNRNGWNHDSSSTGYALGVWAGLNGKDKNILPVSDDKSDDQWDGKKSDHNKDKDDKKSDDRWEGKSKNGDDSKHDKNDDKDGRDHDRKSDSDSDNKDSNHWKSGDSISHSSSKGKVESKAKDIDRDGDNDGKHDNAGDKNGKDSVRDHKDVDKGGKDHKDAKDHKESDKDGKDGRDHDKDGKDGKDAKDAKDHKENNDGGWDKPEQREHKSDKNHGGCKDNSCDTPAQQHCAKDECNVRGKDNDCHPKSGCDNGSDTALRYGEIFGKESHTQKLLDSCLGPAPRCGDCDPKPSDCGGAPRCGNEPPAQSHCGSQQPVPGIVQQSFACGPDVSAHVPGPEHPQCNSGGT